MFETKESKDTKAMFYALLYNKKPQTPFSCPLIFKLYYFFPYNSTVKTSLKKKHAIIAKTTKPDYDNIPKQIQDVMTKLGFWTDDAVIFNGGCEKYFAEFGKIIIEITPTMADYDYSMIFDEEFLTKEQL